MEKIRQALSKVFPSRNFLARERLLGVASGTRSYDLPLAGSSGNGFLRLLIALMSVLGMLALSASFALSAMSLRWSEGLDNKISVEIPASDSAGEMIAPEMVREMTDEALKILNADSSVREAAIVEESRMRELLAPWLGENMAMESVPLPGLISVTLDQDEKADLPALEARIKEVAPRARIDTHESWLTDVLRFTGALQFTAALVTLIIGITTLVAVAGAVRSKLSENKEELELLHLMGATDSYIARQLQRHTLILSLQGGLAGIAAGALVLLLISLIAGEIGVNLLPNFSLSAAQWAMLALMPLPIALLAMMTARFTVLRVLTKMP